MHIYTFANLLIFSGSMQDVVHRIGTWIAKRRHTYVCVTGAHGIVEAQRNPAVMEAHSRAGLIVPDGMPLVWMGKAKGYIDTQRIYGPDLMLEICKEAQTHRWRVFLYGTTKETLDKLQSVLLQKYPHLIIVGAYSPPFDALTKIESQTVMRYINQTRPNIIFVGLSTPKQELWMQSMISNLHVNVLIGVGAAFDFIAGTKKQAPRWVQQIGLEWAYRVLREPKRLLGRYIYIGPRFLFYVFSAVYSRMHFRLLGSRIARISIVVALTVALFCLVEFVTRVAPDWIK